MSNVHYFVVAYDPRDNGFYIDYDVLSARFNEGFVWNDEYEQWMPNSIAGELTVEYMEWGVVDEMLFKALKEANKKERLSE